MSDVNASSYLTLYHGTSTHHLPAILQSGLCPSHLGGVDDALIRGGDQRLAELNMRRLPAVFVTSNINRATCFAAIAAEQPRARPAVLEVRVPETVFFDTFVVDEICEQPLQFREDFWTAGVISPDMIAAITNPDEEAVTLAARLVQWDDRLNLFYRKAQEHR